MAYVDQAFRAVEEDPAKVVLLGMHPSEAEPEYGYIVPGKKLYGPPGLGTCEVSRFIEKPHRHVALDLVSRGGLWNTLVMIFKTKFFLKEIARIDPRLFGFLERIWNAIGTSSAGKGSIFPPRPSNRAAILAVLAHRCAGNRLRLSKGRTYSRSLVPCSC